MLAEAPTLTKRIFKVTKASVSVGCMLNALAVRMVFNSRVVLIFFSAILEV